MIPFHQVEKWNGRFYQKGALWQVGVKIYAGHNGAPCPKSLAALSKFDGQFFNSTNYSGNVLGEVAAQFGKSEADVIKTVSDALDQPMGTMSSLARNILDAAATKSGMTIFDLLQHLKQAVHRNAEDEADTLRAASDRATAQAEIDHRMDPREPTTLAVPLEADVEADDDWEDEDDRPAKGDAPRFLPRPPPTDGAGNPFLTLFHANGMHALPIVWCVCPDHLEDRDLQLLDLHLYPASYDRIKTVFTFECLDDHRYNYLECKSSHYQFHNKLRRATCPQQPDASSNRYAELCRVARQWRNLKYRKWFWLLHNMQGKRGEMALFCAACPQDGVNLEENWKAEQEAKP